MKWPRHGFTLVEMLVTVAIIALVVSVAAPVLSMGEKRRKEGELRENLRDIRRAIDAYKEAANERRIAMAPDASGYPPQLDALWKGVPDITRADGRKVYFLRSLPRDPFYPDPKAPAETTWSMRSYASLSRCAGPRCPMSTMCIPCHRRLASMACPIESGKRRGFTLIELLVVLAIIALLLSIVLPNYFRPLDRANDVMLRDNLKVMRKAIDQYQADKGGYPENLQALVSSRYLQAIPVDPITGRADTWVTAPHRPARE